jgi:hypothetical protein
MGVLILKNASAALGLPIPEEEKPKYNKYKVLPKKKRTVDGVVYDSGKEAYRHSILKLLLRNGEIANLETQKDYPLIWNGVHIAIYRADFVYTDVATGQTIIEDVKGMRTRPYIMKKRMMKACYGIDIYET